MKKGHFELKNALILNNGKKVFHDFSMQVYEGDCYGIICDSIEDRNHVLDFLRGRCELQEGKCRYRGKETGSHILDDILESRFSIIQKKSKLIHSLSIVENICIFADMSFMVHKMRYLEEAEILRKHFDLKLDLNKPIGQLSEKERIIVELLKAYAEKKEVIVLSDLSSFLQNAEQEEIHELVLKLQNENISFILVEGYGELLFNWSNRILIIKNGTDFGCFNTEFLQKQKLYNFLSNREKSNQNLSLEELEEDDEILEFDNITSEYLSEVSFRVGTGEVLKILCLDEKSMEGIRNIFWGLEKRYEGKIKIAGETVKIQNPHDMRMKKIAYCRERAYKNMLIPDMSVRDNIMIDLSLKLSTVWSFHKYRKSVDAYIESKIGSGKAGKKVRDLPLVERQQLAFLKLYLASPRVLICEKPFFEEDLRMKEMTLKMLEDFRNSNIAVIILTANLQDISLLDGDDLYIRDGNMIDEDEAYQIVYNM